MKICVVTPSTDSESEGTTQTHAKPQLADYIDTNIYPVESRQIGRGDTINEIDDLWIGNFDVFINYLFHQHAFDQKWGEALKYLNTKDIVGIGSVPDSALDSLIANAEGSTNQADRPINARLFPPRTTRKGQDGDFSVLVVQIGQNAVALTPLEYKHPDDGQEARWKLAEDSDLSSRLKELAVSAFELVRGTEYLGYLSVNFHVDRKSGDIATVDADPAPRIFYGKGTSPWDDEVIAKTFPGGHAAFFEVILSTRLARIPQYLMRNQGCARQHDRLARLYHTILATNVTQNRLSVFVGKYDFDGTVLDCCSGSGEFARFAIDAGVKAKYTALDYSVEMTALPHSKKLYEQPFIIGPVQEVLTKAGMHDHVVCFGSFHLLQPFDFFSTISQMFLRAKKSVTFDVDDLSETYIKNFPSASSEKCWEKLEYNHNNVANAFRFGTPVGWRAVLNGERRFAYRSLVMQEDVHTHSFRFEKIE